MPLNTFQKVRQIFSQPSHEFVLNELLCHDTVDYSPEECMNWLEQILHWLFQSRADPVEARFRYFFNGLDKNPEWKERFQKTFSSAMLGCGFLDLFTDIGLGVEHGLWGDLADRIARKLVPVGGKVDFREMFLNVFTSTDRVQQLQSLSEPTLEQIEALLSFPACAPAWERLAVSMRESLLFLATHAAHYGISAQVRGRLSMRDQVSESSFLRLSQTVLASEWLGLAPVLEACQADVASVYSSIERSGVSVDVVNRLETISALLEQIRRISSLARPRPGEVRDFVVGVIETGREGRRVLSHVRRHFFLLSLKIVERNGESGEHYIARSRSELWKLGVSAIGGGAIVVVMTVLKTWLIRLELAPLFLATGIWVIYAAGFLSMQFSGCTLATKIPSFTASKLAQLLKTVRKQSSDEFRLDVRLVLKSQGVALLGNVAGVIPLALLVDAAIRALSGGPGLMDEHYATHTLSGLHPLLSFALPLGALTGVELWLSSLAGGWLENWIVFNQIPRAIERHYRFRKIFGAKNARILSEWARKHSSGIATNVALGFLFGFVPLVGGLFGANWNGNHVTISTAGAVFAARALDFGISAGDWAWLVVGLGLIGFLNFIVSFGLALYVAGYAQKMRFRHVLHYFGKSLLPSQGAV